MIGDLLFGFLCFCAGYLVCMRRLAETWRPPHFTRKAKP